MPQSKTDIFLKKGGVATYGKGKDTFTQDITDGVEGVLKQYGTLAIEELRQNLFRDKSVATGNLAQSINPRGVIKDASGKQKYVFEIAKYYKWVDAGRGPRKSNIPGNPPLRVALQQWMDAKGIFPVKERKSIAFFLARKINRSGTTGNKFFSAVFDDEFKENLKRELSIAVRGAIEIYILER